MTTTNIARPRCSCGRVRRQAATACQKCLDVAALAAEANEPPRMFSRQWRATGFLCVIRDGRVYLAKRDGRSIVGDIRSINIDQGRWTLATDRNAAPWTDSSSMATFAEIQRIARDCYCSSFPDGCDFCNGVRRPDGSRDMGHALGCGA